MNPKDLEVRPAFDRARWNEALHGRDTALLEKLVEEDTPGIALAEVAGHINGLYRMCQLMGEDPQAPGIRQEIERVLPALRKIRHAAGWHQRTLDLNLLRWIRRSSALSAVIGAGVTVDAGGPSWPRLVERLIGIALEDGHQVTEMEPLPGETTATKQVFRSRVVEVRRFDAAVEQEARQILTAITQNTADTEALMRGAQCCYELFGQHLFTHLSELLYAEGRKPGPIHRAIAALAHPQFVPERQATFAGWDSIITYNFDDFMGQALDDEGLARAVWAMRGDELAGDPNPLALQAGQGGIHQSIYHLHGYTPNPHLRPFLITHVRFVFATSQYLNTYSQQPAIFPKVVDGYLANPVHYALYLGCSFADEAMNRLLHEAATAYPGRTHYAMLKWPGTMPYAEADADEIERHSARYVGFGVQPVWFEKFSEIPQFIARLK